MPVYQMRPQPQQPQVQYYKPKCRKEGDIKPIGSFLPGWVWKSLLFVSFAFSGLFMTKITMNTYLDMFADAFAGVDQKMFFFATLCLVSAFEVAILYIVISIYNFIAIRYTRGEVPLSSKELFKNLMPFFLLRNLILGGLSTLMFLPGGMFVSIGLTLFEPLATMIIFFPAFFAIKKRYIKKGYGKEILQAYAIPYIIIQAAFLIF